eukprot:Blabericola_migrator_1__4732@NODE_2497_length_2680_cov_13_783008_g1566_i0_p2_GENE_NODE_2497_length_2680_cov_13_783008_g1566_i0NODE_2497_length_2680_cov_13_783008_g1566_i0_p2_ORF_typecomplete_len249_score24_15RVT_1/PF00078_27/5_8e18HEPN_RnaseLS/PF18869_1/0_1KcnmB2_inactiv/PF09303_10/5_2e03KcnmB2_inactiv/PF09303_10/0_63_NODE_2497_length_2680_cov_13_783008_g1566_i018862632
MEPQLQSSKLFGSKRSKKKSLNFKTAALEIGDKKLPMSSEVGFVEQKITEHFDEVSVKKQINPELSKEEQDSIYQTLRAHEDLSDEPVAQRPYRLTEEARAEIDRQVDELIKIGAVEPCESSYACPAFLVPLINYVYSSGRKGHYFSTVDLKSGYWQVPVRKEDRKKLAFITHRGLYQWNVMPFGPSNAPSCFSRIMYKVLRDILGNRCEIYLDDTIIGGKTIEEHNENMTEVLKRLEKSGLYVNIAE